MVRLVAHYGRVCHPRPLVRNSITVQSSRAASNQDTSATFICGLRYLLDANVIAGLAKPTVGGQKPTVGAQKPTVGAQKPTAGGQKPSGGAQKPTVGV